MSDNQNPTPGEILDAAIAAAIAQFGVGADSAAPLRREFRAAFAGVLVSAQATALADRVRGQIIHRRVVEAVVHALGQRGRTDPLFRELAGFGQPLPDSPDVADWLLDAGNLTNLPDEVVERVDKLLDTLTQVADEQTANELVGGRYYLEPQDPDAP